jgi:hypothetical protein
MITSVTTWVDGFEDNVMGTAPYLGVFPLNWTHNGATAEVCSPPPCEEGLGVGVPRCGTNVRHTHHPPPRPSPNISAFTRVCDALWGEGAHRAHCTADHISAKHALAAALVASIPTS